MERSVALVVGCNGVVGQSLTERLAAASGWEIVTWSRRGRPGLAVTRHVQADLHDRAACRRAAGELSEVTHLFYCARAVAPAIATEQRVNLAMFANLLDAVEAAAPGLRHVQLMEGSKWYGCHLGHFKTPSREDDPRLPPPNPYYAQQDLLELRRHSASWSWSALRPHTVWGLADGPGFCFVRLLAAYAAIRRRLNLPLSFPGSAACFAAVSQATDARLLAEAMVWAATTPGAADNAFNLVNGDLFRWRDLWPRIADLFAMPAGPVETASLAERMADKAPVWDDIVRSHGLRPTRFAELGDWAYLDFTLRFGFDSISAMTKARRHGFDRFVDTEESCLGWLRELRDRQVVP